MEPAYFRTGPLSLEQPREEPSNMLTSKAPRMAWRQSKSGTKPQDVESLGRAEWTSEFRGSRRGSLENSWRPQDCPLQPLQPLPTSREAVSVG
jgi:hypothetical protein